MGRAQTPELEIERRKKISKSLEGRRPKNSNEAIKKAWDKNRKYRNSGMFKKEELHPQWKGDDVSYMGLHNWVKTRLKKSDFCQLCGSNKFVELSNKSHKYKRDLDDWWWLCARCHRAYDKGRGDIKEKYG